MGCTSSVDRVWLLPVLQSDTVYQNLTAEQQLLLWEQGVCPGNEVCMIPKQCLHWFVITGPGIGVCLCFSTADRLQLFSCKGMGNIQHRTLSHGSRMCMPNHLHQISLQDV